MLLLGDQGHYHGRFPWVTASLVVVNVIVYVAQVFLGEPFTNGFSLVPEEITTFQDLRGTKYHPAKVEIPGYFDQKGHYHHCYQTKQIPIKHYTGPMPICLTLFTSMFMHANLLHLIGNMWFFLIFGRNVECALNHGRFLAFYVACGVLAGLAHVASEPHSIIPCLGASGAISGVMGAYVSIFPFNKIKVWFGWFMGVIQVPALVVIGIWFVLQYVAAFATLDTEGVSDSVAHWDHLGGFTAGFLIIRGIIFYLRRRQAQGALTEEEPLAPVEETFAYTDEPPAGLPPGEAVPPSVATGIKAGAPDPFATCLSVPSFPKPRDEHFQHEHAAGEPPQ